jgi:methylated-DNA-[protein]-cysteine S-methyltransferase
MEYIHYYNSPLGGITLLSNGVAISGLGFDKQKYFIDKLNKDFEEKNLPIFKETVKWLDIYFSGKSPDFTPQLLINTTDFRKSVLQILLQIPYGQTMTYGEIAKKIANNKNIKKMSAQAVGGAVGHNPIAIIIPCHRVIGANRKLTGYAGGIDKKLQLLKLEKVNLEFFQ